MYKRLQPVNIVYTTFTPCKFRRKLCREISRQKSFRDIFSGNFGENPGEIFPGNSRHTFFTRCCSLVYRKCTEIPGEIPGEIFPSGVFPKFPKFSRREIFSTHFRYTVVNILYVYNCLQSVNVVFRKFTPCEHRRKLCQEVSREKVFPTFSPEIFPEISPPESFFVIPVNMDNSP